MSKRIFGVWWSTNALDREGLVRHAEQVERLGYDTLWFGESASYEAIALAGFLLGRTSRVRVSTGIANIYARDALAAAAGHDSLNRLYGNRFMLGLGVSHAPLVEGRRKHAYLAPIPTMRAYLEAMAAAPIEPVLKIADRQVVLAALGPKMLGLARDLTRGAHPYNVTPEHTAEARQILGAKAYLAVEQKICFTTDARAARATATRHMKRYFALPNYCNNWRRLGFTDADFAGDGSNRLLDAMVVWGKEADIRKVIDAHYAAGADEVCIQPVSTEAGPAADARALAAFAPGGG